MSSPSDDRPPIRKPASPPPQPAEQPAPQPEGLPWTPSETVSPKIAVNPQHRRVESYQIHAILCLLFCCLPLAIPALIYSSQVNNYIRKGDYMRAEKASQNARLWCLISLVAGLLVIGSAIFLN